MHIGADLLKVSEERFRFLVFCVCWCLMASAMLVESDVYRYVTVGLVIFALIKCRHYVRMLSGDWLGVLCYAWSAYAFLRFASGVISGEKGASEWLYIFPVFYPLMGAALFATRRSLFAAATLLLTSGLICLFATLDVSTFLSGTRAAPLFHYNPIHAGIGVGMLVLTAIFWLLYVAEAGYLKGRLKWPFLMLGILTTGLGLIGVLGAQSKGVWLALAATMVFWIALSLLHCAGRKRWHVLAGMLLATVVTVAVVSPYVGRVAGTTIDAALNLTSEDVVIEGPLAPMQRAIADSATPSSMRERLMLWSNAIELIQAAPWIGWGNFWLQQWHQATYSDVGYTIIHNGYLEIMVRHGLLGIVFLAVFAVASVYSIRDANHRGVISWSLSTYIYSISFFFFFTITTNSNNRLALGEAFFIFAAAAVFAIRLATREAKRQGETL